MKPFVTCLLVSFGICSKQVRATKTTTITKFLPSAREVYVISSELSLTVNAMQRDLLSPYQKYATNQPINLTKGGVLRKLKTSPLACYLKPFLRTKRITEPEKEALRTVVTGDVLTVTGLWS
jgi:hypothetical protein